MRNILLFSILALVLAITAWALFGYEYWRIGSMRDAYSAQRQTYYQNYTAQDSQVQLHTAYRNTAEVRARLHTVFNIDPEGIARLVEQISNTSGVRLTMSNTAIENTALNKSSSLQTYSFVLTAQGPAPALVRALQAFEAVPAMVTVDTLDLVANPEAQKSHTPQVWNMSAHVQVVAATQ